MKNIKDFMISESNITAVNKAIKLINDAIDDVGASDIDVVIWDFLDGISDGGNDDLVMREIESYCEQHK